MTVALLGVPFDAHSSFLAGAALGPARIREAMASPAGNTFSETGVDCAAPGVMRDAGDVALGGHIGPAAHGAIAEAAAAELASGARLLALGGDHSVSLPLIDTHARHHPGLSVLQIDAHPDLYDDLDGNPLSHASVFARLMETGRVRRLVQVGIRAMTSHQREQAARFGVEVYEMKDGFAPAAIAFDGPFYITLDLDGLDPAHAPGVSHHVPGGLTTREVLTLIQRVPGTLVGADIVELNPHRDLHGMTAGVAASCASELIARLATGGGPLVQPAGK